MTAHSPFDAWTGPGKDAFEFWISFFPTAPLFGVDWRFADMMHPAMSPFLQAGAMPFPVPFPGTRAASAAARPGELDSPARADEAAAMPVARATEVTAEAAEDAGRLAIETGRAAGRAAESAAESILEARRAAPGAADDTGGRTAPAPAAESLFTSPVPAAVARPDETDEHRGETGETTDIAERAIESLTSAAKVAEGAKADLEPRFSALEDEKVEDQPGTQPTAPGTDPARPSAADAFDAAIAAAPKPDVLLAERPENPDDLTTLNGIGSGLQRQLNKLGVWQIGQIARMTDADLAWIDAHLTSFKGRCFRDDWIGQAKARLAK